MEPSLTLIIPNEIGVLPVTWLIMIWQVRWIMIYRKLVYRLYELILCFLSFSSLLALSHFKLNDMQKSSCWHMPLCFSNEQQPVSLNFWWILFYDKQQWTQSCALCLSHMVCTATNTQTTDCFKRQSWITHRNQVTPAAQNFPRFTDSWWTWDPHQRPYINLADRLPLDQSVSNPIKHMTWLRPQDPLSYRVHCNEAATGLCSAAGDSNPATEQE